MYGKNPVASSFTRDDGNLLVNDLFPTLQGEGPDAGLPAVFVRLSSCNLRCYFCDTEFQAGDWYTLEEILGMTISMAKDNKCKLVVITGGEPLLQNIVPFSMGLNMAGLRCSIETAGTVYPEGLAVAYAAFNNIVCSPKTPKLAPKLIPLITAFKYIVSVDNFDPKDGLPRLSTQMIGTKAHIYRPENDNVPLFLQPMDEGDEDKNKQNLIMCAQLCRQFGYRLSVQMHKLCDLP
jgi:7-carboxy-7-deazaguanine synthase